MLSTLQEMSNRARREGTLSLEEFITQIEDDFFARGIQLVVDGHEPQRNLFVTKLQDLTLGCCWRLVDGLAPCQHQLRDLTRLSKQECFAECI